MPRRLKGRGGFSFAPYTESGGGGKLSVDLKGDLKVTVLWQFHRNPIIGLRRFLARSGIFVV